MKCVICGSRDINDYDLVKQAIKESGFEITSVVSGYASGVDKLGEQYAKENNLEVHPFPADWKTYGKLAGFIRNNEMLKFIYPDGCVIAVWDSKSKGTLNTINLAKEMGLKLYVKTF